MSQTETRPRAKQPPNVMVVDDEEYIRVAIEELLAAHEIDVVTATGAEECLALMKDGFRGVILMDVMMPGKNGWDTIRQIKNAGLLDGNIISMLTAIGAPDERMEGLQEVVIDYIVKPFNPEELISSVRMYLNCLERPLNIED